MNRSILISLITSPLLAAAPVVHIDTSSLRPESEIRITFDQAIAPAGSLGKTLENTILKTTPGIPGTITWVGPRMARFNPMQAPPMGKKFTFSLRKGLKHKDGSVVPDAKPVTIATPEFAYEYADRNGTSRKPEFYLRFNDEVTPESSAPYFSFRDKSGKTVAAHTLRATWKDINSVRRLGPTWQQAFDGWERPKEEVMKPDDQLPSALLVTPAEPLPAGEGWRLIMLPGIPNASRSAATGEEQSRWAGTVYPFTISSVVARTLVDKPRHITIELNKSLVEETQPADLARFITIDPVPPGLTMTSPGTRLVRLDGDFSGQASWGITIKDGFTAADGFALEKAVSKNLVFKNLDPRLRLPSNEQAQLASGTRDYPIQTVNLASARIRIKRLAGDHAIRAFQGYRHYTGNGPGSEQIEKKHAIPFELISGTVLADETIRFDNDFDTSETITLEWNKYLSEADPFALLFLSVESTPKTGLDSTAQATVSQAIIQLTDIGLAWKLSDEGAFLYAYSCETGHPLPHVRLDLFGEDAELLETARTDGDGVARLPRLPKHRHLRASWGEDAFITAFDERMPTVSMWRFPVRHSWNYEPDIARQLFLFTDRSLYRPGETVHFKGIVRRLEDNTVGEEPTKGAHLTVRDSRGSIILEKDLVFSPQGSFDETFELPAETVGRFRMDVTWPEEIEAAGEIDNWQERYAMQSNAGFSHTIKVQEFRRNAFEVISSLAFAAEEKEVQLKLDAKYFQGQPVADGKLKWYLSSYRTGFYPANYRDFLFGDHRSYDYYYWSHYFGYGGRQYRSRDLSENGASLLDANGHSSLTLGIPDQEFPAPRMVEVSSEITDLRNQTLTDRARLEVHSSDIYLGVSRVDRLVRVGDHYPLKLVAITKDGEPAIEALAAKLEISRSVNNQVKVKTSTGRISVRNERHNEELEGQSLTIQPGDMAKGGLTLRFSPTKPGRHALTFSGTDAGGKPFRTATTIYVYGTKEYPWAYESGMKIKLVAEKKLYQPGETARVLVLSPIEGTALVTVERNGVQRHFLHELRTENPVIEIPTRETDAPNAFVSVLVIKGAKDNLREHKEPILRLGYCELKIQTVRERLGIAMEVPGDYHRPGEEVTVEGLVTSHEGKPVGNAEITLYAEDEGTLAVAGYQNPNPIAYFYAPRSLRTEAGTSLTNFIAEAPDKRRFYNKGFVIGGGGGEYEDELMSMLREDFTPCAHWAPALVTGPDGRFRATFQSPDTLTRYRVVAVAHEGTARFGADATEFVVNKPLMLEPSVPRFANEGDLLHPKVLVQNSTEHSGTWEVRLQLGDVTTFAEGRESRQTRTITLGPKSSHAISFDVRFTDTGTTDWTWSAQPRALDTGAELSAALRRDLSDAVVSRFDVAYPMPLLRETHFVRFDGTEQSRNLLDGLSPSLLDGRGELELHFGKSLLLEAGGAIDYLLHYPYGCVEQTTSSTIPWIAAKNMRALAPAFQKYSPSKIDGAIQAGAKRLLTMQTSSGGLSYWPGGGEAERWASSYGGMAILLCREAGADVPQESIDRLAGYLAKSLRNLDEKSSSWDLENTARACYVLAMAGKPQVAYHNKLLDKAGKLPTSARLFLALAIHEAGGDEAASSARRLLDMPESVGTDGGHWMCYRPTEAYRLLATTRIHPEAAEGLVDKLLAKRNPAGHWNTTWGNAWSFYALGAFTSEVEQYDQPVAFQIATQDGTREVKLGPEQHTGQLTLPLEAGLRVIASSGDKAYVRVKLAAKPQIASSQPVSKSNYAIHRSYHRVLADGTTAVLDAPKVGDIVKVELDVTVPGNGARYLVIDDPLPSLFETINTEFKSQAGNLRDQSSWRVSHKELRDERAVFFINYVNRGGRYKVSYLARVTSAGEAIAPPAKVEAMYDPQSFGLSSSRLFKTPDPLSTASR